MKRIPMSVAAAVAIVLGGCGGGDEPASVPPPTSGTPTPPITPAAIDFNVYAVQMAQQQGSSYDRAEPLVLDDLNFTFNNDESTATTYASVLPP